MEKEFFMKNRVLTARVSDTLHHEIEFLKSSLGLTNTTSVLTHAIHTLYEARKKNQVQKSSLEMFEEKGLIGCFEGAPDLSTNYKDEISEIIVRKHSRTAATSKKTTQSRK
jgi:hypothetical protein